ncbi:hypothetical protein ES703_96269 [subsurface metagenome]
MQQGVLSDLVIEVEGLLTLVFKVFAYLNLVFLCSEVLLLCHGKLGLGEFGIQVGNLLLCPGDITLHRLDRRMVGSDLAQKVSIRKL